MSNVARNSLPSSSPLDGRNSGDTPSNGGEADRRHKKSTRKNKSLEDNNGSRRSKKKSKRKNSQWSGAVQQQRRSKRRDDDYTTQDSESSGSEPYDLMAIPSMIAPPSLGSEGKRSNYQSKKYEHPVARQRKVSVKRKESDSSDDDHLIGGGRPKKSLREDDLMAIPSMIAPPKPSPRRRSDVPQHRPVPKPSPLPKHPGRRARSFMSPRDRRMSARKNRRSHLQLNTVAASPGRNLYQQLQRMNHVPTDTSVASTNSIHEDLQPRIASPLQHYLPHANIGTPVTTPQHAASIDFNDAPSQYAKNGVVSLGGMGDYQISAEYRRSQQQLQQNNTVAVSPRTNTYQQSQGMNYVPVDTTIASTMSFHEESQPRIAFPQHIPHMNVGTPYKTPQYSASVDFNDAPLQYATNDVTSLGGMGDYHSSEIFPPLSPEKSLFSQATEASESPPKSLFSHWMPPPAYKNGKYSSSDEDDSTLDGLSTMYSSMIPSGSGSPARQVQTMYADDVEFHPTPFNDQMKSPDTKWSNSVDLVSRCPESPMTPHDQSVYGHLHNNSAERNITPSRTIDYNNDFPDLPISSTIVQDEIVTEPAFKSAASYPPQDTQPTNLEERRKKPSTIKKTKLKSAVSRQHPRKKIDFNELDSCSSDSVDDNSKMESNRQSSAPGNSAEPGKRRWMFEELLESKDDNNARDMSPSAELNNTSLSMSSNKNNQMEKLEKQDNFSEKRKWKFEELLASPDDGLSNDASSDDELDQNHVPSESDYSICAEDEKQDDDNYLNTPGRRKWKFEELLASNDDDVGSDGLASNGDDVGCDGADPFVALVDSSAHQELLNFRAEYGKKDDDDDLNSPGKRKWKFEELLASNDDDEVSNGVDPFVTLIDDSAYQESTDTHNSNNIVDTETPSERTWKFEELLASNDDGESSLFVGTDNEAVQSDSDDSILNIVLDKQDNQKSPIVASGKRRWKFEDLLASNEDDEKRSSARLSTTSVGSQPIDHNEEIEPIPSESAIIDETELHDIITIFQSHVRGAVARKFYHQCHDAALTIQRCVRSHNLKKERRWEEAIVKWSSDLSAAEVDRIQKHFLVCNGKVQFNLQQRQNYLDYHSSIIGMLNSRISDMNTLRRYEQYHRFLSSVVQMQANVRARQSRKPLTRIDNNNSQEIESNDLVSDQIKRYSQAHAALVSLQALFRGALCRKRLSAMHSAAILLQHYTRVMLQRRRYRLLLSGLIAFQSTVRGVLERRTSVILRSVVSVQSHLRSFTLRSRYLKARACIILIQKTFRGMLAMKRMRRLHFGASSIQSVARAFVVRRKYANVRRGVISFQALVRGLHARNTTAIAISALMNIQCHLRTFIQKKKYNKMRKAAVLVQSKIRAFKQLSQFETTVAATLCIQSFVRGSLVRKQISLTSSNVVIIQRRWAMYRETARIRISRITYAHDLREEYLAATKIQSAFRMNKCLHDLPRKKEEHRIDSMRRKEVAAIRVQSAVRMWMCRHVISQVVEERDVARRCDAAVVIQSFARSIQCRRQLALLKEAAVRADLARLSASAVVIQSFRRSVVCQRMVEEVRRQNREHIVLRMAAATTIQSKVRSRNCKKELTRRRLQACKRSDAAAKLQSQWRSWACRKELALASRHATTVQRCYNRFRMTTGVKSTEWMKLAYANDLREEYLAATKIQSAFRMHQCWHDLLRKKKEHCRASARKDAVAAIRVQSAVRMWMCRHVISQVVEERDVARRCDAAVVIQSFARSIQCQRQLALLKEAASKADLARLSAAAIVIQSFRRSVVCQRMVEEVRRQNREHIVLRMAAATTIQSKVRSRNCKKELTRRRLQACKRSDAATKLQSQWRSWACRKELALASRHATTIQRCYNRFRMTTGVKSAMRMKLAYANDLREEYLAATKIQSAFRMRQCGHDLLRKKKEHRIDSMRRKEVAAIRVQSAVRMWMCRHVTCQIVEQRDVTRRCDAAVVIQSFARSSQCQRQLALLKEAASKADLVRLSASAVVIQSFRRSVVCQRMVEEVRRQNREHIVLRMAAATTIQSKVRSRNCKKELTRRRLQACKRSDAATKLQSQWRSWACRKELALASRHATTVQRCYNRFRMTTGVKSTEWMKLAYANDLREEYLAATKIQSAFRMHQCWHDLLRKKKEHCRASARKDAVAAIRVQSAVRMWMCRHVISQVAEERDVARRCNAAVVIQSFARSIQCQRQLALLKEAPSKADHDKRLSYLLSHFSSNDLAHLTRVQALFRGKLLRTKYRNAVDSAICIQKHWKCQKQWKCNSYVEVVSYSVYFKSILMIQKKFRRCYSIRHSAAKQIQLSYLSRRMKRHLTKVHQSVNLIQRSVRGHQARSFVQSLKMVRYHSAATKIQSIVRAHLLRSELRLTLVNIMKIQRCYRRSRVTLFDNVIRDEKKAYVEMLKKWHREAMAVRIQTVARSWLRLQKRLSTDKRINVDTRTMICPTSLDSHNASATVIQSLWRSSRCCKELLVMREAAVVIQSRVRSRRCHQELRTLRSKAAEAKLLADEAAAITLQAFARSLISKKQVSKRREEALFAEMQKMETRLLAAGKIQSIVRAHRCRRNMQLALMNASKIQRCYLRYKADTLERVHRDEKKKYTVALERCHQESMATRIQTIARLWLLNRERDTADSSATIIQSKWRSHRCKVEMIVRRTQLERRKLIIQSAAAVAIQSIVRSRSCRRELTVRKERLHVRESAAVTIQSFARSYNVRIVQSRILSAHLLIRSKSAILIQSIVRMYLFRSRFDVAQKAAYIIQHAWRQFVSSLQDKILAVSSLLAESRYSCRSPLLKARTLLPRDLKRLNRIRSITPHLPRRYECGVFIQEVMNSVVMVIQSFARRHLVMRQVKKLHKAAATVQASWRSTSRRKKLDIAVLKIQSAIRGRLVRGIVSASLSSTITPQLCSRTENEVIVDKEVEQNAAILIQRFVRVRLAKNSVKLRLGRGNHSRLLDEDDDLNRLTQYFSSLRFTSKQHEEAAEVQWCEEMSRIAEEAGLQHISTSSQKESVKEAAGSEASSTTTRVATKAETDSILKTIYQRAMRMATKAETDSIMRSIYQRAETIANESILQRQRIE